MLPNARMNIDDTSIKLFLWTCIFSDIFDEVFHLINFLVNAIFMPSFFVELNFFVDMISIDKNAFILVCFGKKNHNAVFQCKIKL